MGGFPRSSVSKESACNAGDLGSIPESGRFPGEGNGNPLQYSCLENPMDRGAQRAIVHGVPRVGHDLATKPPPGCYWASQVALVVKNPPANAGDVRCGAWWAAVHKVTKSRTRLSERSSHLSLVTFTASSELLEDSLHPLFLK